MVIDPLEQHECEAMLARIGFGRLACVRDGQPYIVPIYFAHQPGRLYGFATVGQKIEWMRENPNVCVQVDQISSQDDWVSVVVVGRYEELPDTPEHRHTRDWAKSLLKKRSSWSEAGYAASKLRTQPQRQAPVLYSIHVREVSGMRASPGERIVERFNLKS
jgi:nitroimidazol reductase NimA-like FMN-containing flavoprotein (pyridoxamine 5'-phosphate oxidase superfamily)